MSSVQTGGYTYTATAIHNSSSTVQIYEPFSNASPASVASVRRMGAAPISDDEELGDNPTELPDPEVMVPVGSSWVLLLLAVGYVVFRQRKNARMCDVKQ